MENAAQTKSISIYRIIITLVEETFRIALVAYIVLLVLDQLISGFVSSQVNLNVLLWAVIITGLITILVNRAESPAETGQAIRPGIWSHVVLSGVSLVGGYFVFSKLGDLGSWRMVVALITAGLIYLIGSQLLFDDQSQQ